MTDITTIPPSDAVLSFGLRRLVVWALVGLAVLVTRSVIFEYVNMPDDHPALVESTFGQLAVWMADQSGERAPVSLFGQLAKSWAAARGEEELDEAAAISAMRWPVVFLAVGVIASAVLGVISQIRGGTGRRWWMVALGLTLVLLFLIPVVDGSDHLMQVLLAGALLLVAIALAPGPVTRTVGFVLALSALLIGIEVMKGFAASNGYTISASVIGFDYRAYETLDEALSALQSGEVNAVFADSSALNERLSDNSDFADLRVLTNLRRDESRLGLPVNPAMPGRLTAAVRAEDAGRYAAASDLLGTPVGAVAGDFAETNYLARPRSLTLIDLKIFNDVNLPHLQAIAEAFLQPARRNGPVLLTRILAGNALYTWSEAALGFATGAALGFVLGALFAHSKLMQRGLLPYVVASQTVPILAIAPMIVIWLGAGPSSVAVISAYLTFFPVTINTLRGLSSPSPIQVDLMRSYAANSWAVFTKLRLPAAVPYIFTALKVSATASVVGAIIGELPSSIRDGLARAILDFSSAYNETSTPKLYAAIITAAGVGIAFFVVVSLVERVAMRRYIPHSSD